MRRRLKVHILKHGFPICGFSRDLPVKWPLGHLWVAFNSPEAAEATCGVCIRDFDAYRRAQETGRSLNPIKCTRRE